MNDVVYVGYKQVYDLVFRAQNARLDTAVYVCEFLDWVKAGIAFNTRGYEVSTRKISNFVSVYNVIKRSDKQLSENDIALLKVSLTRYYEDLYYIYQSHLESRHNHVRGNKKERVEINDLALLPSFEFTPCMYNIFRTEKINAEDYTPRFETEFLENVKSAYLKSDTNMYKCMAILYDYVIKKAEEYILLEVSLC